MSDREILDAEMRRRATQPRRLPMVYRDGHSGAELPGSMPVVSVTEDDIRLYGAGGHVCGECKHFEPGHAAAEMAATKFMPHLVRDREWKLEHAFLSPTNESGLCGDTGTTLTFTMHAACPNFRPHNGKIKRAPRESELAKIHEQTKDARQIQDRRIRDWRQQHAPTWEEK